jgi:L-fucose mutarotase
MLKNACINPEIMSTLSFCGHGDKIMIVDGNYPLASKSGNAKKIYLGVSKGLPTVTDVLKALLSSVNFETAEVMMPRDGSTTEIMEDFKTLLPEIKINGCDRWTFYEKACNNDIRLAISTGEQRFYGCIILTIFVA